MSAYPAWALICAILGCIGAVVLLAWNTAQEQRAGRFDSLIAVVAEPSSLSRLVWQTKPVADFQASMTVEQDAAPDDQRVPTAVPHNAPFEHRHFHRAQRPQ